MTIIGTVQELPIIRVFESGYILDGKGTEVFLHKNQADREYVVEERVNVFIYKDHQGRYSATMNVPSIRPDEYGLGTVVKILTKKGVFVDVGLTKDLFIGESDLPALFEVWPNRGDRLYCTMKVTNQGNLIGKLATEDVFLEMRQEATETMFNKNVQGYVVRTRAVGTHIFTDEGFYGFIHESERLQEPRLGERITGRIIDVKMDGQINVSLLPRKQEVQTEDSVKILEFMESRNGAMPYSDKSDAEDIMARFEISKGAFKRALGKLMKEGKVYQENGWTYDSKHERAKATKE